MYESTVNLQLPPLVYLLLSLRGIRAPGAMGAQRLQPELTTGTSGAHIKAEAFKLQWLSAHAKERDSIFPFLGFQSFGEHIRALLIRPYVID